MATTNGAWSWGCVESVTWSALCFVGCQKKGLSDDTHTAWWLHRMKCDAVSCYGFTTGVAMVSGTGCEVTHADDRWRREWRTGDTGEQSHRVLPRCTGEGAGAPAC